MVWCRAVWYGMVLYGVVGCGVLWYCMVWYDMVCYGMESQECLTYNLRGTGGVMSLSPTGMLA